MKEFGLARAKISHDDDSIEFAIEPPQKVVPTVQSASVSTEEEPTVIPIQTAAANPGTPVTSPMMGVYYASPSPGSPAFVSEGDSVTAGQVIGLIEAMKVFNEITAPTSGTISSIAAESGKLVHPGEPLMYIS